MLVAIGYAGNKKWLFRCDCGREKEISKSAVMRGRTKSCGCANSKWRTQYAKYIPIAESNGISVETFIKRIRAGLTPEEASTRKLYGVTAVESLPNEVWKPISGYEGLYEVSNLGRVKSLERTMQNHGKRQLVPERILRPGRAGNGYYTVALNRDSVSVSHCIHVLVATAFVEGRTDEKCVVNHKDETRDNNIASNLEWCTPAYNTSYGTARQRGMETIRKNKSWNKPPKAVELIKGGNVVASYYSINEAARETGYNACTICGQCKGNKSKRPGYQWRYAEEVNP